jgi:nitrogen fixation protein FixH
MSRMFPGPQTAPDRARSVGRGLTGRMVLAMVLCFFATVGTVNAVMIRFAMTSFRGEVVDHPYERGLLFNSEIAAARAQAARHWTVEAHIDRTATPATIRVEARDEQGRPIKGLRMVTAFVAPVNNRLDQHLVLQERQDGSYEGELAIDAGSWNVEIIAARADETVFRSRSRLRTD